MRRVASDEGRLLHKVSLVLSAFRSVAPTMPIQLAHTFVLVAMNEGASVVEIQRMTGFKYSTISRHLLDLGARNRKREPGYNLVQYVADPMELRKHQYTLTDKGRELMRLLMDTMKV